MHQWDTRFDIETNWKPAIDNFGETCHLNTQHRNRPALALE